VVSLHENPNNRGGQVFPIRVADCVQFDHQQAQLFHMIGREKSLFGQISQFPDLAEKLRHYSQTVIDQHGTQKWRSFGGAYDDHNGTPTFEFNTPIVGNIVAELAKEHGGLLYDDAEGNRWAVRLIPIDGRRESEHAGFAIRFLETSAALTSEQFDGVHQQRLNALSPSLHFSPRSEQVLWFLSLMMRLGRSYVLTIPDAMFKQLIWGGHDAPPNWRHEVFRLLASLSELRMQRLQLGSSGWVPRVTMYSVAVASVERLELSRGRRSCLYETCLLHNSSVPHGHFVVQVGRGLLGILDHFVRRNGGTVSFDFRELEGDLEKQFSNVKGQDRLIQFHLPTKLFGPAKWSGLTPSHRRIIHALTREITRPRRKRRSDRPDGAEIITCGRVPGRTVKIQVGCPLLCLGQRYVGFCGNGRRRGLGYGIIGRRGTGWLFKFGYRIPDDDRELARVMRQMFDDLAYIADIAGLVVAGFHPRENRWIGLPQMREMLRTQRSRQQLAEIWLRVFAPENYHERLRGFLEQAGQMTIPAGVEVPDAPSPSSEMPVHVVLTRRLRAAHVSQQALAGQIGCSQQFISRLLTGKQPQSEEMQLMNRTVARSSRGLYSTVIMCNLGQYSTCSPDNHVSRSHFSRP